MYMYMHYRAMGDFSPKLLTVCFVEAIRRYWTSIHGQKFLKRRLQNSTIGWFKELKRWKAIVYERQLTVVEVYLPKFNSVQL